MPERARIAARAGRLMIPAGRASWYLRCLLVEAIEISEGEQK
jgi:hypothetical protein